MRKIFALLVVTLLQGQTIPRDKQLHFITGAVGGAGAAFVAHKLGAKHPALWGLGFGLAAGVAKELYDRKHRDRHTPEALDALATTAGAGCGAFVVSYKIRF